MNCEQCGTKLNDDTENYTDYHIICRPCFDKTHVLIPNDPEVEWVGYKKYEPGLKPAEKDEK